MADNKMRPPAPPPGSSGSGLTAGTDPNEASPGIASGSSAGAFRFTSTGDPDEMVFRALLDASAAGRRVILATVVEARGSVPRGVGSKMVIDPAAGLIGTIGGGCGEGDVIAAASSVLDAGRPRRVRVELMDSEESWSPAVCGGFMEVLLEPVEPDVEQV